MNHSNFCILVIFCVFLCFSNAVLNSNSFCALKRILHLLSESRLAEMMYIHRSSNPSTFGVFNMGTIECETVKNSVLLLQTMPLSRSLIEKLKVLVQVSQEVCGASASAEDHSSCRKYGAEELISILCFVIIQSKTCQLISECHAVEQLFDVKYMLGEEGYALSSFMTALKYIEIKLFTDCYHIEDAQD